ncbi:MAG TPA: desulfoferrodoxin [Candidatus Syntrophosphaera sp.]|jgi:superoxide reductase|nr:desulfoferrodoxin [Candidatus Syntrophosphaera sp.]
MIEVRQIYHCPICGNLVEVLFAGGGELVCCGQPMKYLEGNTVDAAREKHVPVLEELGDKVKVSVGSVPHPMEEKHYITMIEVLTENKVLRRELKPGDAPEAVFRVKKDKVTGVREYCNLHGLWKI